MSQSSPDHTDSLRSLMQQRGLASFQALSHAAGVSKWQIEQLRQGKAAQMRVQSLHQLSQALQVDLAELLVLFSDLSPSQESASEKPTETAAKPSGNPVELEQLQREYQHLQTQLVQQKDSLQQEFQQASLQVLESWLLQFPTAAFAAQQNPEIPAARLLPLMRPIEQLLKTWKVEAIAAVGTEAAYDPQLHQLMEGTAQPGDPVKIRYAGYRQSDKLLYRAKVSPVKQ